MNNLTPSNLTPEERRALKVAVGDRLTAIIRIQQDTTFDSVRVQAKEHEEALISAATKLEL